ncbi:UNVERIFIED_CONTAM: hypothetical protein NCL1_08925 [Trichonephila clavipes]
MKHSGFIQRPPRNSLPCARHRADQAVAPVRAAGFFQEQHSHEQDLPRHRCRFRHRPRADPPSAGRRRACLRLRRQRRCPAGAAAAGGARPAAHGSAGCARPRGLAARGRCRRGRLGTHRRARQCRRRAARQLGPRRHRRRCPFPLRHQRQGRDLRHAGGAAPHASARAGAHHQHRVARRPVAGAGSRPLQRQQVRGAWLFAGGGHGAGAAGHRGHRHLPGCGADPHAGHPEGQGAGRADFLRPARAGHRRSGRGHRGCPRRASAGGHAAGLARRHGEVRQRLSGGRRARGLAVPAPGPAPPAGAGGWPRPDPPLTTRRVAAGRPCQRRKTHAAAHAGLWRRVRNRYTGIPHHDWSFMALFITVAQLKGGAGKSTVATNLAGCLSREFRTGLIDADLPQGTASRWAALRADPALSVAVCDSAGQLALEAEKMDDSCDVVVIDMPPRSLKFLREALAFSDLVLMPLSSSPADVWAAEQLVDMVREARKTSKRLTARLLWNRVRSPQTAREQLASAGLRAKVMHAAIGSRVAYAEALGRGLTVAEWRDPRARAEFAQVVDEVCAQIGLRG